MTKPCRWMCKLSLSARLLIVFVTVLVLLLAGNYTLVALQYRSAAEDNMVERAAVFTALAEESRNSASELHQQGLFNKEAMLAQFKQAKAEGRSYADTPAFNAIPVIHSVKAAEAAAQRENVDFSVIAQHARRKDNQAVPGTFDATLLSDLVKQASAQQGETISRLEPQTGTLHYMRAIRLAKDCLVCHGDPATSPTGDGKDVLGFPMENLKEGSLYAAYHVRMPMAPVNKQVAGFIFTGLLWTVPLTIGAIVLVVWLMRKLFSRPIGELIERIRQIAAGNLTLRVESNRSDEIGRLGVSFNHFIETVENLVRQVRGSTANVASAATEIAASNQEIANGTQDLSRRVEQITSSVTSMTDAAAEVAGKAGQAVEKAEASGQLADQGGHEVGDTIDAMTGIRDVVDQSSKTVEQLGKRGEEIGQIIGVINDIAEQTNLLALNAAIEAARAGEQGRGFSVVADEVRKLADRTTRATEEIAESIKAIQSETDRAVNRMHTGTEQVSRGAEQAGKAGTSLNRIVASADAVREVIQTIAGAMQQQAASSEELSRNIATISSAGEQATQGTHQAAEAASHLSEKAEQLRRLVGRFRIANAR